MKNILMILFLAILLFACNKEQNEEAESTSGQMPGMSMQETAGEAGIAISDAWVRPAGKNTNTGMFLNIKNNTDTPDTLTGAESDVAEKTEVHETFKKGDDMMGMREVDYLVVKPHETFVFKPMDHHIMLIKLNKDIAMGDTVTVNLLFKHAGEVPVKAVAKEQMPMKM